MNSHGSILPRAPRLPAAFRLGAWLPPAASRAEGSVMTLGGVATRQGANRGATAMHARGDAR